ncbi:nucleotidyltransferase domain-containing protein [Thermococcus sp. 21S9]|uniref:nucleotidyltransferase domain-containing protein n=1 Tax=Thermococcus sp. 21S9 TaxID=1638223 RepID=UPI00143C1CD8|nr:nucleotidyltransferase domain-containing protein [Thermococcus sp. 21S9]NJE54652.1 nucleotidyltransferase domain-containing protein [Thermococcus sp. 21S9]
MRVERLADCLRRKLGRVLGLHSLILYGSLVRGDFIPGTSDVDFFAVLEDGTNPEEVLKELTPVLEECSAFLNPVEVDVAWEWASNLSDPLGKGYPYKFLTVYQRDFRENHVVLLGEDVTDIIPEYALTELLPERLEGIMRNLGRFGGNKKMLHILAGETARLMAVLNGSSLRKDDVLATLRRIGDEEALRIYRAYLDGRKTPFTEEFLTEFIRKRVEELRASLLP